MAEIKTPLRLTVLEYGDLEYTITDNHTISDVLRHLASEADWQEIKCVVDMLASEPM